MISSWKSFAATHWRESLLLSFTIGWWSNCLHAAPANSASTEMVSTNLPLKNIAPGIFELGKVRFDKNKGEITFPGAVNMDRGPIEYALVHSTGKVHESLLRTDVEPYQIHVARLLAGTNGMAAKSVPSTEEELKGDRVIIQARWKSNAEETSLRIEDLIFNSESNSVMSRGPWIYTGSRFLDGTFLAQRDGSLVAIMSDPDALINNPRPGRENDKIWQVNSVKMAPVGTPVEITIQLEKKNNQ